MSAINNPTNSFTIAKSKAEIFEAVKKITVSENTKYSIFKEDDLLNRISIRERAVIGDNGFGCNTQQQDYCQGKNAQTSSP